MITSSLLTVNFVIYKCSYKLGRGYCHTRWGLLYNRITDLGQSGCSISFTGSGTLSLTQRHKGTNIARVDVQAQSLSLLETIIDLNMVSIYGNAPFHSMGLIKVTSRSPAPASSDDQYSQQGEVEGTRQGQDPEQTGI